MKFIHFPTFLIALSIGLFFSYITMPQKQIIYVYPTPDNAQALLYKDNADNCFKYTYNEVTCPMNLSLIHI